MPICGSCPCATADARRPESRGSEAHRTTPPPNAPGSPGGAARGGSAESLRTGFRVALPGSRVWSAPASKAADADAAPSPPPCLPPSWGRPPAEGSSVPPSAAAGGVTSMESRRVVPAAMTMPAPRRPLKLWETGRALPLLPRFAEVPREPGWLVAAVRSASASSSRSLRICISMLSARCLCALRCSRCCLARWWAFSWTSAESERLASSLFTRSLSKSCSARSDSSWVLTFSTRPGCAPGTSVPVDSRERGGSALGAPSGSRSEGTVRRDAGFGVDLGPNVGDDFATALPTKFATSE
mmetsp:Transcript_59769/g.168423  ORF Transcript_59769/g.168423 Transcript_59769/m.168423 type:complete len:298 (-) Transcript_59769:84-977(-)